LPISIRLLSHYGDSVAGKLLMYDAMTLQFRTLKLAKDPHCEVCGG
ncbi:MAG TPA: molybdopterin-synthase adenylyltransferase MoeB, partial [Erwinia sp.]|nr:molybdopterin-synthase adenylyltransferase MoeB [Erwinia sp.]